MNVTEQNGNLILHNVNDFNLRHIFECGQCFRWERSENGAYTGIAGTHALTICQNGSEVILYDTSSDDYNTFWKQYFDLERSYADIKTELSKDPVMKNAIVFGEGIRLLRQELWECIVSFIISASNNIPRIKKIVKSLCENFGTPIKYMGQTYYSFPDSKTISSLSLDDLSVIKAGFRDKYILDAAVKVENGLLDQIYMADNVEAKRLLMSINGIGNKVADCVMLFGLSRYDSFPVDVWIKRIMEYCYFDNKQTISDISVFSREKFGRLGGFAQQYLFFYARENNINT